MDREEASAREWCKQNGYVMMQEAVYESDMTKAYFEGQNIEPCEDAIRREAVIEALNCINGTAELDEVFEIIEKSPSVTPKQKMGRWIPVSERLPEEPGEYLIAWTGILGEHSTKRTRPLMSIAEYEICDPENYADWITTMYEFEYYRDIKVLAWMPLPEPYKAESEEV